MSADPLRVLGRLRRHEVDAARRELAAGLLTAAEAEASQRAVTAVVAREVAVVTGLGVEAVVAAAFAGWWQRGQALVDTAQAARDVAVQAAARARAGVAAARAAAELVEVMRVEREHAGRAVTLCMEQTLLDAHGGRAIWLRLSAQ